MGEEDSVIFTGPLSAEVVKAWSSSKLPANFHPAGFCARLSPPLLTPSTPSFPSPGQTAEVLMTLESYYEPPGEKNFSSPSGVIFTTDGDSGENHFGH